MKIKASCSLILSLILILCISSCDFFDYHPLHHKAYMIDGKNFLLYILTLKQNYYPWNIKINDRISFKPLSTGAYATLVLNKDEDIWLSAPDKYDSGYYWHSNRMRFHVYLGESVSFKLKADRLVKSIDVFYEISTCDLYVTKYVKDNYYDLSDIIAACVGVRFSVR